VAEKKYNSQKLNKEDERVTGENRFGIHLAESE
jgi:hypothetical protein